MNADRMKALVFLLKLGGLWLNFSDYQYGIFITVFQLFRIVYLIVGLIFIINLIFLKGLKFLLTPSAVFIPLGFNVVVTSMLFFLKIQKIEVLISECDKNLNSYFRVWEHKLIHNDTQKVKNLADCLNYGMSFFAVTYMIFPIIINIARAVTGNLECYTVPLPFDGYLDETKQRNDNFYIVVIASNLWFVFGIANSVSFQCSVFYIISCATTEICIIKQYIKSLPIGDGSSSNILPDWNLIHIIKKHTQLLRINELQNQSIALPNVVQCRFLLTLSICFVMFLILQLFGNDTMVMILAAMFVFILLALSLVHCTAGEYLEEKSDELFYEVCSLPWYRQSVKSKKDYLMLVLQTSKTLVFDYAFTSSINLSCFMQMMNNSFSYLMVMKSLSQAEID